MPLVIEVACRQSLVTHIGLTAKQVFDMDRGMAVSYLSESRSPLMRLGIEKSRVQTDITGCHPIRCLFRLDVLVIEDLDRVGRKEAWLDKFQEVFTSSSVQLHEYFYVNKERPDISWVRFQPLDPQLKRLR